MPGALLRRRIARTVAIATVLLCSAVARADDPPAPAATLRNLPITITAPARYRRVARKVETICREEVPRIATELGLSSIAPIEIIVTDNVEPFNQALGGELPGWGIAFALLEENRILVDVRRATREFNSLDEVVPHELSHLLVHQRAPDVRFPIWFLEGLAQWQAREWSMVDQWQLMQGVWSKTSPRLIDLTSKYPVDESRAQQSYRVAYAGFTDLFAEVGFDDLAPFLDDAQRLGSFEAGFRDYFGYSVMEYAAFFQNDLEKTYGSGFMFLQSGPLLAFAALLFIAVIIRYWIRRRRKFAHLDD